MEFVGAGIKNLSVEYRGGIDVMTTETTCLSSIWVTDNKVKEYLEVHQRGNEYAELNSGEVAYYDKMITVDLSQIQSMIALPFHPSNVFLINELNANMIDILDKVEKEGQKFFEGSGVTSSLKDKVKNERLFSEQGSIAATEIEGINYNIPKYYFNKSIYDNRIFQAYNKGDDKTELRFGPNIADWPKMEALTDNMLLQVASVLLDPVTTTDELIPSGDTSSYRSNLINWGILPLVMEEDPEFKCGDFIYLVDVVNSLRERRTEIKGYIVGDEMKEISVSVGSLTDEEIEILLSGCLINYNRNKMSK